MGIADLSNVLSIFRGSEPDPEKQKELFKEVLLMTLARASSSDSSIHHVEVESIQGILQRETGEEFSVKYRSRSIFPVHRESFHPLTG
jgi:hypothetical protein